MVANLNNSLPPQPQTKAKRQTAKRRAEKIASGKQPDKPPLAPIEHRRLLKEGRNLLGEMSFDDLKLAIDAVKAQPSPPTPVQPEPETVETIPPEPVAAPPLRGSDGNPICNASAARAYRDEYRLAFRRALEALLAEPEFDFVIQKSRIALQVKTKSDGWDALIIVERKRTRAEIADFTAREKALGEWVEGI